MENPRQPFKELVKIHLLTPLICILLKPLIFSDFSNICHFLTKMPGSDVSEMEISQKVFDKIIFADDVNFMGEKVH